MAWSEYALPALQNRVLQQGKPYLKSWKCFVIFPEDFQIGINLNCWDAAPNVFALLQVVAEVTSRKRDF